PASIYRFAARPLGRQRVEHVDDADDLREQRHLTVAEAVGVTRAVEPLVMMAHDRTHGAQRSKTGAQRVAHERMLAHHPRLVRTERAVFQEDAVWHGNLADVVQKAAALESREVLFVEAHRTSE